MYMFTAGYLNFMLMLPGRKKTTTFGVKETLCIFNIWLKFSFYVVKLINNMI